MDGVESFVSVIDETDSLSYISNITKEIDVAKILDVAASVYQDIPYYLTESDYARIDSLLSLPDYIHRQLDEDKQMLQFPSSSLLTGNISRDPLNLFTPVLSRIKQGAVDIEYETYDSYILSPDEKKAIVIITSSFGANESENNAKLIGLLNDAINNVEQENPDLDIHIIGGPAIAVSNATQIKKTVCLQLQSPHSDPDTFDICFQKCTKHFTDFSFGRLGMAFCYGWHSPFYNSISIIVIGIASVILGIAVNYPLHLIDHLQNSTHPRQALKEIISPLVVGNVTTVGAFLCLVPLNSIALHDLGLFSSLLLVGTILFVLIFLPHVVKVHKLTDSKNEPTLISKLADISVEKNKWVVYSVIALTIFLHTSVSRPNSTPI